MESEIVFNFFKKYKNVFDPRLKLCRKIIKSINDIKKFCENYLFLSDIYERYKDKIIESYKKNHFFNPDSFYYNLI